MIKAKLPRPKKCKWCKKTFQPTRPIQPCCGYDCEIDYAIEQSDKKRAKKETEAGKKFDAETKARRIALRSRQWYLKEAQKHFNKFIRLRDKDQPCISCGREHTGQYHAGHFKTTAACPELRYEETNCHKQCAPCNNHMSGNIVNYRPRLIEKIGVEKVEWLEGHHEPSKLTIDDLKELIADYKLKCKSLAID